MKELRKSVNVFGVFLTHGVQLYNREFQIERVVRLKLKAFTNSVSAIIGNESENFVRQS